MSIAPGISEIQQGDCSQSAGGNIDEVGDLLSALGVPEAVTDQAREANNAAPQTDSIPLQSALKIDPSGSTFSMIHSVIHMASHMLG